VYFWDFDSPLIFSSTQQEETAMGSGVYNIFVSKSAHELG
jgi:hypothetical protein